MIATLISLLVVLLILGIVWWALNQIPLPPPLRTVAVVVIALVAILVLLQYVPLGHPLSLR